MFLKKFKRQCSVRGCKNVEDVFLISKRREMGNTIGMCRSCLKEALQSLDNYQEPAKVIKEVKPLFPHPELKVTLSSVADEEPKPQEVIDKVTEDIPISVAEDTVAIPHEEVKPTVEVPAKRTTTNSKKKPNKKK